MKTRFATMDDLDFLKKGLFELRTIEKRPVKDIPVSEEDIQSFKKGIEDLSIRMMDDDCGSPGAFIYWRTDFRVPYVHGEYLWIDILFVREDLRGKGMGRSLYEDAIQYARKNGLDRIVIDIFDPNERSRSFHSKLEFQPFYTIYTKQVDHPSERA